MHKPTHPSSTNAGIQPPKKRHNRKRRNWNVILRRACAVALIAEAAVALFANPHLRVTKVQVEGVQTLSEAQVFAEAQIPARTNIFWMALRPQYLQRLRRDPVIDEVSRTILLPHTLVLRVRERQPYATLAEGKAYWLLDRDGVPYRALSAPQPGVPVIEMAAGAPDCGPILGQALSASALPDAYALLHLVQGDTNLDAAKIKVDQNANLCLNRKDNLQIKLGQPDSLPQKVRIAQAAVSADGGEIARRAAYIDVSCPEQPVWMPRPETQESSKASHNGDADDLAPQRSDTTR